MLSNSRFFSRILLPSMVAVVLFLVAIYLIVIPNYRESLMDGKRETIRELTNTAWSVMHKLDLLIDEDFSLEKAKSEAILIIGDMRWGDELKDYFWITDTVPIMVMHPYRPMMNGMDLTDYKDTRGKNFFVDIVKIVRENGDGYVDYKWQWKDDSLTVVPKLSYVKSYEPWGWIVGTGIYIDDVNREISNLTRTVVWISAMITLLIAALISYLARRNYISEVEREKAQERLRESMVRYKKLVEASTDGVLMLLEGEIVYCNPFLLNLLGFPLNSFEEHDNQLFQTLNNFIDSKITPQKGDVDKQLRGSTQEFKVKRKNEEFIDVIVSYSKFEIEGKQGYILAVKDVSKHKDVERELDLSTEKFKSISGLMNLGVFRCSIGRQSRFIDINSKAIELLGYSSQDDLKNTQVQELFDVTDEKKEVIRAINEGLIIKDRLLRLKRADGTILPAIVSLFPVNDSVGKIVYCDGILIDAYDHLCRDSNFDKNTTSIHLSANMLLRPVKEYLISAPTCNLDTHVETAARVLSSSKTDIILVINESNIVGLITNGDITRRAVAKGKMMSIPVSEIMSAPVIAVSEDDLLMDAFTLMVENRISYVVVKPKKEEKPSYISLMSLSSLRKDTPEYIVNALQKAETIHEIFEIFSTLPQLISVLVDSGTGVIATGKLISTLSDAITQRIIDMHIKQLGEPPVPFVFLALGSEGRGEQTLATDQDNAIIFQVESSHGLETSQSYFLELGKRVCESLSMVGFPLCKGGVMAMNRDWCMEMNDWKKTISSWISIPNPQEILNTSIFFDFRPVYGDFDLANQLQLFCQRTLKDKNVFFYNLAQSTINLKIQAAEGMKEIESYDIKLPLLAITSIARLWSLRFGIGERSTSGRLLSLQSADVISSSLREEFDQAFRFLMLLRIKNQLRQIERKEEVSNSINPKHFSEIERIMLKRINSTISDHQSRLGIEFRMG